MDTSDPEIVFDECGVCNLCTNFFYKWTEVNQKLKNSSNLGSLFDEIKRKGHGRKYDCVVGVSGGVDSSTVIRLAVDHGLRVLAVHMDNGWNTPIAARNIHCLVDTLNVNYVSYVLPWDDFRKVQLAFLRASVPEVETPTDIAIQRALHKYALKYRIRYILGGGNNASEGILPISWHYNARDSVYARSVLKSQGCSWKHFSSVKYGFLHEAYYKVINGIQTVYPLNYINYEKEKCRKVLERDYGWTYYGSKHGESRFTRFVQGYYLYVKHGIDYRRATASSEVCLGALDRRAAIERLEIPPFEGIDIDVEMDYVAKKLLVTRSELEEITKSPAKWYFQYRNNKKLLGLTYDLYRFGTGKKKTSNF